MNNKLTANDIRRRFIEYFVRECGHAEIPSASLIPENDPTVLFTTAGMHPLVPYLLGEKHPKGCRLVDAQKCVRTDDVEEVGDDTHLTFFEMLGNWSLGDYFKREAIGWSFDLLTNGFGIEPSRLRVTCFEGDADAPIDDEAASIWEDLGFVRAENASDQDRQLIYFYEKKKNWWGPAGQTGPCGPDTEMFFDRNPELNAHEHAPGSTPETQAKYPLKDGSGKCHPNCECGRYVEIWNDVFMQYFKKADGTFEELAQKNVDTGMGLERMTAIMQGVDSHYETELFAPVIEYLTSIADSPNQSSLRIIADHLRAATFILGDPRSVTPSNTDQGYVLRRLIRRAIRHAHKMGITTHITAEAASRYVSIYGEAYPELAAKKDFILEELTREEEQFAKTLQSGEKEFFKILENMKTHGQSVISGRLAFKLYDTFGFPLEMTTELAAENGLTVDVEGFEAAFAKHQELSRAGAEQKFAGGLADHSEQTTRLHTAHHLLLRALQMVLGDHVKQRGSNITAERLRIDFNNEDKMTPEQIAEVEKIVNDKITEALPMRKFEVRREAAEALGAQMEFGQKYPDVVTVYFLGGTETGDADNPVKDWFSAEFCGGPHVTNTSELGHFKIQKEQSSSRGIRRIKAGLE